MPARIPQKLKDLRDVSAAQATDLIAYDHAATVAAVTLLDTVLSLPGLGVFILSATEPSAETYALYDAAFTSYPDVVVAWGQINSGGNITVSATTAALILTENSANINAAISILAGVDALALTENPATVSVGYIVSAGTDALVLTTSPAGVNAEINVQAGTAALILTEYGSTVNVGSNDVVVSAGFVALTLTENPANINAEINVIATVDSLSLTEAAATVDVSSSSQEDLSTFESGTDGWTYDDGAGSSSAGGGRSSEAGVAYAGSYGMWLEGSYDDGEVGPWYDGSCSRTLNVVTGNMTVYAKGEGASSTLKIYRNGSLIDTKNLTTSYDQYTVALTGGTGITVKLESSYATNTGCYVDNIAIRVPV